MLFIQSTSVLYLDDFFCSFWRPYEIEKIFSFPDHGSVTTFGLNQLFSFYIPDFLKIHPQTFVQTYGLYFRIFLYLFIPLSCIKAAFLNKKNILMEILFSVLIFMLLFNGINYCINDLGLATGFYRLTFPIVLECILLTCFAKIYINKEKLTFLKILPLCILSFFLGNSSEMITGILFVGMIFVFIAELFLKGFQKTKNFDKNFCLIPISFLTGLYFLVTSPDFARQISFRNARFPNGSAAIEMLPDFITALGQNLFLKHFLILFIIFAAISFLFFFVKTERAQKTAIFASAIAIGWIVFFSGTFVFGKTHYSGGFWVVHPDIQSSLQICLLYAVSLLFGEVFSYFAERFENKTEKITAAILLIVILSATIPFVSNVKNYRYKMTEIRKAMYLYDKMTLFYWYRGEKATVPFLFSFADIWAFADNQLISIYRRYETDDVFHKCYISSVYKEPKWQGYIYEKPEKAYKIFKENGGTFTLKELDETNFEKLYDKNFVLNKK